MTHDLDPRGLEAAEIRGTALGYDFDEGDLERILTAYLEATAPEGDEDARTALQRLVDLKDGPRDAVYSCTKHAVWQAARDALARKPAPKGEPDRIAVVCDEYGHAVGVAMTEDCSGPWDYAELEMISLCGNGPFARQIVRVHLRRPEPPAEVVGSVE